MVLRLEDSHIGLDSAHPDSHSWVDGEILNGDQNLSFGNAGGGDLLLLSTETLSRVVQEIVSWSLDQNHLSVFQHFLFSLSLSRVS